MEEDISIVEGIVSLIGFAITVPILIAAEALVIVVDTFDYIVDKVSYDGN